MTTMRRISRRDLLGLGAAAGVVAVSGAPAHALPERGGSLRLGLAGRGIGDFDGRRPFDPIMRIVGHGAVFDCLTEIGADGAIRGELATGWEASADARVWTFRLREDAVFHDGRPFGADDVVATLRLHMAGGAAAVAGRIAQVRRTGPHEVQIVLREGMPGLPFLLADPQLVILPAHAPDRAMTEGIGTGLYRMEPGRTAERAVLRRVERHWKDGAAGWFERLEVLRIAAPAARFEALKSGRVDAVNLADPAWEAEARRHGRIAIASVPGPGFLELAVEGAEAETAEAVARAVAGRIDGEAMLASAFAGRGRPALPESGNVAVDATVAVRVAPDRVPGAQVLRREIEAAARAAGLGVSDAAPVEIVARVRPGRPTPDWPAIRPTGAAVVPLYLDGLIAHATRLHHAQRIGGLWDMDSGRIAERWWYS
jgi:peptide/nickel transport system substrate-binding protein